MSLDQFLAAERDQESGGNYGAVNSSSGALGAYQVMPDNVPEWTTRALGHSVSTSEFLSSPADQDAVAQTILGGYYDKYGPAGAAAMWYSGQPDPTKGYGDPPVWQYVKDVISKMGSTPDDGGSSSGGGTTSPADDTSGSTVHTAGLQQAGYDAVIDLTPWGIPLNPFKLPGWIGGKLSGAAGSAEQSIVNGLIDSLGPIALAVLGCGLGAGLILIGAYATTKPAIDSATEKAEKAAAVVAA
jgi:hypothetical protein